VFFGFGFQNHPYWHRASGRQEIVGPVGASEAWMYSRKNRGGVVR
jgi:hypothetical protein